MKRYYIYKITNLINQKIYIGKHVTKYKTTSYMGSGLALKSAIKKYGINNFKKEILEHCTSKEQLSQREKHWIKALDSIAPKGYNLSEGGDGGNNFIHSPKREEIIERIRKSNIGRKCTEEQKQKMSETRTGVKISPCKKEKCCFCYKEVDIRNLKRWHNENCVKNPKNQNKINICNYCNKEVFKNLFDKHIKNCSEKPKKKRTVSQSLKKQISIKLKGRSFSEEHKTKIGEASKRRWKNESLYSCNKCNLTTRNKTNITRWHNEKCKIQYG